MAVERDEERGADSRPGKDAAGGDCVGGAPRQPGHAVDVGEGHARQVEADVPRAVGVDPLEQATQVVGAAEKGCATQTSSECGWSTTP